MINGAFSSAAVSAIVRRKIKVFPVYHPAPMMYNSTIHRFLRAAFRKINWK